MVRLLASVHLQLKDEIISKLFPYDGFSKKYLVNEWQAFKKYFIFIATFFESQQWRLIPIEKLCYVLRILQYKEGLRSGANYFE